MARFSDEVEELSRRDVGQRKVEQPAGKAAAVPMGPGVQRARMTPASVLAMQRSVGNAGTSQVLQREEEKEDRSPIHNVIGSGGSPLDNDTRETMEDHLGSDFSDVRLHVDAESAESVDAAAYTVGNDVVLHPNHFTPGTPAAQRTLAHELTHVVQQRSGPVEGTARDGGIKVSDPSDRFEQEAEASASNFESSQHLSGASSATAQRQSLSVQREDEEDETEVQEIALQREGEDEEDETEVQEIALQREGEEDEDESEE